MGGALRDFCVGHPHVLLANLDFAGQRDVKDPRIIGIDANRYSVSQKTGKWMVCEGVYAVRKPVAGRTDFQADLLISKVIHEAGVLNTRNSVSNAPGA